MYQVIVVFVTLAFLCNLANFISSKCNLIASGLMKLKGYISSQGV